MLGVAMVGGVAFIAVLEHHFAGSVDPGKHRYLCGKGAAVFKYIHYLFVLSLYCHCAMTHKMSVR